uniref:Uncharacterized protein n=1 Tax=Noccaea caerulescens TaxID=107243 RepID=A0A1J3ITW6_NOCCA
MDMNVKSLEWVRKMNCYGGLCPSRSSRSGSSTDVSVVSFIEPMLSSSPVGYSMRRGGSSTGEFNTEKARLLEGHDVVP